MSRGPIHNRTTRTAVPTKVTVRTAGTSIRIDCQGAEPPGLNGKSGHFATHWAVRAREKDNLLLMLRSGGIPIQATTRMRVEYVRSYLGRPMDRDNLFASFKMVGDALVKLGYLRGDSNEDLDLVCAQLQRGKLGPRYTLTLSPLASDAPPI